MRESLSPPRARAGEYHVIGREMQRLTCSVVPCKNSSKLSSGSILGRVLQNVSVLEQLSQVRSWV